MFIVFFSLSKESWSSSGKLGPEHVLLEKSSSMGNMVVDADHLEV